MIKRRCRLCKISLMEISDRMLEEMKRFRQLIVSLNRTLELEKMILISRMYQQNQLF